MKRNTICTVCIAALLILAACENMVHDFHRKGGGGGGGGGGPSLTVIPGNLSLDRGLGYQFKVSGLSIDAVTWTVTGGNGKSTIGPGGFLSVHGEEADNTVLTVTAVSANNPQLKSTAAVTVKPFFLIEGGHESARIAIFYSDSRYKLEGTIRGGRVVFDPGSALPVDCRVIKSIRLSAYTEQRIGRRDDSGTLRVNLNGSGAIQFRAGSPVPIGTYAELQLINTALSGTYVQEADLYLGDRAPNGNWIWQAEWTPIGDASNPPASSFTGTYDGDEHLIDNLYINQAAGMGMGLFGLVYGATLRDIHIGPGSSVTGNIAVGGVAGAVMSGSTVTDCTNRGRVTGNTGVSGGVAGLNEGTMDNCSNYGSVTGENSSGGVVGSSDSGSIENCSNYGSVTGKNSSGGVAGSNAGIAAIIENCSNYGSVTGEDSSGGVVGSNDGSMVNCFNSKSGAVRGTVNTGGVVGQNRAPGSGDAAITACFNAAPVTGTGTGQTGGVAGRNYDNMNTTNALITACYNTGTVTGTGDDIGGVVGINQTSYGTATVTACYNSGAVTGTGSNIGGVIGENDGASATNSDCYWYQAAGVNVAASGIGTGGNTGATPFGDGPAWPANSGDWTIGAAIPAVPAPSYYWQSLGSWNGGAPQFPQLYWE
jgi:hypothetical protein